MKFVHKENLITGNKAVGVNPFVVCSKGTLGAIIQISSLIKCVSPRGWKIWIEMN